MTKLTFYENIIIANEISYIFILIVLVKSYKVYYYIDNWSDLIMMKSFFYYYFE